MSDFKTENDLNGVKKVLYGDKLYNVGNAWDNTVELFRDGEFSFTVDIKSLKKVKQPKGKMKRERTMKTTKSKDKKAVEQHNHKKQKEKKYVLLEDIVIKAGTVFYDSGETTFCDHYEMSIAFGNDHVGNFLVEKEMLEDFKLSPAVVPFTELIE